VPNQPSFSFSQVNSGNRDDNASTSTEGSYESSVCSPRSSIVSISTTSALGFIMMKS
jgi:hypothetical protein